MVRSHPGARVTMEEDENSFDPDTLQVLDDNPNRILISGVNNGPRSILVFVDGGDEGAEIEPGDAFTIRGSAPRIMVQVTT